MEELGSWISFLIHLGESTNAGFTIIALIALVACLLLYRGTLKRFKDLEAELARCNDKHERNDRDAKAMEEKHDKEISALYRRLNNVSISTSALWTIINMSGDRRGYQLPPLDEVLEGRMVIQVRAGQPEPSDKRAGSPPLVFSSPNEGPQ